VKSKSEIVLKGIPISPGIIIGEATVWRIGKIHVDSRKISVEEIEKEIELFKKVRDNLVKDLELAKVDLPEEIVKLIDVQISILKDVELEKQVMDLIKEKRRTAEFAIHHIIGQKAEQLEKFGTQYLKDRAQEIRKLGRDLLKGIKNLEKRKVREEDKIIVTDDVAVDEAVEILKRGVKAVIVEGGGKTSHAAIIFRDYKIIAVFGVENATKRISNGDLVIVDGAKGLVIVNPQDATLAHYKKLQEDYMKYEQGLSEIKELPAVTVDGREFVLMANIDIPEEIELVKEIGDYGVGLFRTELLFYSVKDDEERQYEIYREVAHKLYPFPLTIRAFDIGGDKAIDNYYERNPFLGLRGIRLLLQRKDLFRTQLRAIMRANDLGNIRFMIPMVCCYEEVVETKKFLLKVKKELEQEGYKFQQPKFGIMVEVPSLVFVLDKMADMLDFVSIGTNDITQYTLAVDRKNPRVSYLFSHLHPSVIHMIKLVTDVGRKKNLIVDVCGEISSDPYGIVLLVGIGVDELSLTPSLILETKKLIRNIEFKEAENIVEKALSLKTPSEVKSLVYEYLRERAPYILEFYE